MGVPNLPGVPALLSYDPLPAIIATLLTADSPILNLGQFPSQWGIFNGGVPVVFADSAISFSYKQEWAIADYPVEQGAFETYDKVNIPFDARFKFAAGGNDSNRQSFLDSIAAVATDKTTLFTVVTPEEVYPNVTVSHYDYPREAAKGNGLIQADVWCLNVMVNTANNFQSTQAPSGTTPINDGTVQAGLSAPSVAGAGASGPGFNNVTTPQFPTSNPGGNIPTPPVRP